MELPLSVRRVAVLGAGVMGAQIAAHFVNAGFEALLYDLPSPQGALNALVEAAIQQLSKLKPAPLATKAIGQKIIAKNYQEHLSDLQTCDLIIEAVAERFDIKQSVYEKITPYLKSNAIVVSNTSGLSITKLAALLPETIQSRFCGVHFFNPPRYMHLLELIPAPSTALTLLGQLEGFFVRYLGKGVVRAKDTPNFIANRIGVFSMLATMYHAERLNIPFEVVDALTGTLLGRPKSATFRTMDVVGLDTMAHVVKTMHEQLKDDPWHAYYQLPEWLHALIARGALGQKSGAGIYKKEGKAIKVISLQEGDYVLPEANVDPEIRAIFAEKNLEKRFVALQASNSSQAQFLWACFRDLFHYCAYHLQTIANTTRDIDLAVRWGFGWQQGPFETWQSAGISRVIGLLNHDLAEKKTMADAPMPAWLMEERAFYQSAGALNVQTQAYQARSSLPVYQRQLSYDTVLAEAPNQGKTVYENEAIKLWTVDDAICILSFKTNANCIGSEVLDGTMAAIDIAESQYQGLVLWQQNPVNFSVGANLKQFINLFTKAKTDELRKVVYAFQRVALRLKYSAIPTVAAVRGRALGGGCELLMHCDDAVASLESYIGLVEVGVGLLPAGGGLKELALRASRLANGLDSFPLLERYFKAVAMGEVASSAYEAKEKAYLKPSAQVILNPHECLYVALTRAKQLAESNYLPPIAEKIAVAGREGYARLAMLMVNMAEGGFISAHDKLIAEKIAYVICGGGLDEGGLVDEEWFLRLELDAFIELAQTEKTQARVRHLLETGKPLRN